MITSDFLWAKLFRDRDGRAVGWHSLVDHSADVAAVLQEILVQPTIGARLAQLAGRETLDETTRARLGVLAFLHDIGKANRGFRARVDPKAPHVGHIDEAAWLFTHGAAATHRRLRSVLGLDRMDAWADPELPFFDPVFAHHGRPWRIDAARNEARHWRPEQGSDPIADLAAMRNALDRWFPHAFAPGPPLPDLPGFWHAFAGLLMLADWLGSDAADAFFPPANGLDPNRMAFAAPRAEHAVRLVGLAGADAATRAAVSSVGFAAAFAVRAPRPVQVLVALPVARCLVLEAETGSGKTEAALWRFQQLFARGAVDGMYLALPTRVAATAMFDRVRLFRDRVFGLGGPAVVLAVPGQVMVDAAEGRPLPDFGFEWDDRAAGNDDRSRWAAEHPKRFLAARIAVGTIDQALLGAIRVRHSHLRAACLLRHLLVVDEVHASDRYMEALLSTLLNNHLAAGGHALLLSATLGGAARARLLGVPCPTLAQAEAAPYPALSWSDGDAEQRCKPDDPDRGAHGKTVAVETAGILDRPDEVAERALSAARAGAKVLVIRNTVAAAVATMLALEQLAGPDGPALFRVDGVSTLHHGRFAASDRRLLDEAVNRDLGRCRDSGGRIVVGTQTLEVSLDLDSDLLLTDLCPADVLLQRIGRLHRHGRRDRPAGFAEPRVVVLVPAARDLVAFVQRRGGRHGLGAVYEDLCVIEATWRQIEAHPVWTIPLDNRRLVERTTHPEALARILAELEAADPAWARQDQRFQGKVNASLNEAATAVLDWSTPFDAFRLDADEHFGTRLGLADRQVSLAPDKLGPFGKPVTMLRIPHFWTEDVPPDAEPEDVVCDGLALTFRLGHRQFTYSRVGLQPMD